MIYGYPVTDLNDFIFLDTLIGLFLTGVSSTSTTEVLTATLALMVVNLGKSAVRDFID